MVNIEAYGTFLSKNKFPLKKNATRKKEHAFDIKGYSIMVSIISNNHIF